LELCLADVRVLVDHGGTLRRRDVQLPILPGAALLYPGPTARDLSRLGGDSIPTQLVVIDGTWHHAHTLYRDIPGLCDLPHVTLPTGAESEFQVRRQPARHCLSTLEAVHQALVLLEAGTERLQGLVDLFRAMNRQQLAAIRRSGRLRRHKRLKPRVPRALAEDFAQLVVAYAETAPSPDGTRLLVSLSAERLATGERFDCVLRQAGVAEAHLAHMGLDAAALGQGAPVATFRDSWSAFVGPGDVIGVWSQTTLDALAGVGVAPARALVLKAAYRGLRQTRGGMDDVAAHEGRIALAEVHPRRHGRLANAAWVARVLHDGD
jgi:hypothetical protein